FHTRASVRFLPPLSRLTCNQYAVCPLQFILSVLEANSFVNNLAFRDFIERFTFVQLSYNHLTPYDAFSSSLNTITFNYSTMKWFIYSSRKAYMRDLPSSLIQH